MTRSGRSLLRQASVLLLLFCFGAAPVAPALAQGGPAPEPAPRHSQPRPEPAPGATPQPSQAVTRVTRPPVPPPPPPVLALMRVQPSAPARSAPALRKPRQVRKRETAKGKPAGERTTKQAVRKALPSLSRKEAGSPNTMLLIGGLALVVLVLCDTAFLTLSTRFLRDAG
jgi:hypothetical protein